MVFFFFHAGAVLTFPRDALHSSAAHGALRPPSGSCCCSLVRVSVYEQRESQNPPRAAQRVHSHLIVPPGFVLGFGVQTALLIHRRAPPAPSEPALCAAETSGSLGHSSAHRAEGNAGADGGGWRSCRWCQQVRGACSSTGSGLLWIGGEIGLQISREARLKLGSPAGGMRGMCHVGLVTGAQRRGREHSPGQQWGSDAGRWDVPGPRLASTQGPL